MKYLVGCLFMFVGLWGISYNLGPTAFGSHAEALLYFGMLSFITTAGVGILVAARGNR